MDINSGNVSFGRTCPGSHMQDLLRDKPDQVRKITKFQTSLSTRELPYQCPLPCEDLKTVDKFITAIDNLEEVSVLNFEPDCSPLWPAIFHHGKSLQSLAVHTPPQTYDHARTWTPDTVKALSSGLPNLRHLEMDIAAEEAESLLTSRPSSNTQPANSATSESIMDTLAAQLELMPQLHSLLINITLKDEASLLCGEHTWNVMGCISFPQPNTEVCERLAQVLLNKLNPDEGHSGDTVERKRDLKLQIRLVRRCWDDRCQFYTLGYSIPPVENMHKGSNGDSAGARPVSDGGALDENSSPCWKSYLPPWPKYGGFLWRLAEDYRKGSKQA